MVERNFEYAQLRGHKIEVGPRRGLQFLIQNFSG